MKHASFFLAAAMAIIPLGCFAALPYAGEQSQSIKSLSQQETADYLSGKGMGFAKAAELNGYVRVRATSSSWLTSWRFR